MTAPPDIQHPTELPGTCFVTAQLCLVASTPGSPQQQHSTTHNSTFHSLNLPLLTISKIKEHMLSLPQPTACLNSAPCSLE
ncbi:uncharacterized [Tachysurus ichikawai]